MRLAQSLNISSVVVTFCVSKLRRSSEVKEEQLLNMLDIVVTFAVLNLLRSNDSRELHK